MTSGFLTAACGSIGLLLLFSTPARGEFRVTACHLFTPADVEQALQVPVGEGAPRVNAEDVTSCLFTAGRGGAVSVVLRRNASKEWVAEQKRRMGGPGHFRTVNGVADSAFVLDARDAGAVLFVFRGEYYLQISVFRLGDAGAILPATMELARKALSRF